MQETSQGGWLLYKYSSICKSGQLKINSKKTGSQCNCLSSGSDGENRGALRTKCARQFFTRWSLAKSTIPLPKNCRFLFSKKCP